LNDSNGTQVIDLKIFHEVIHREALKGFEPDRPGAVNQSIQHRWQALDVDGLPCDIQRNVAHTLNLGQFSKRSGPHADDVAQFVKLADDF
jgi:hypothetical protein